VKFTAIYERVLLLWPEEILISDGFDTASSDESVLGTNLKYDEKYYKFPALSAAWDDAEAKVDSISDSWTDMMVWTMFQEFHSTAEILIESGMSSLKPREVSISAIENRFRHNLNTEGWEAERDAYEGL
jgi:hypothetical protein